MSTPDVMQAIAAAALACAALTAPWAASAHGLDDGPLDATPLRAYPALSGVSRGLVFSVLKDDSLALDSTIALCMPDLYCALVPAAEARDASPPRLARTHASGPSQ
jgi:hypothetical protein